MASADSSLRSLGNFIITITARAVSAADPGETESLPQVQRQ